MVSKKIQHIYIAVDPIDHANRIVPSPDTTQLFKDIYPDRQVVLHYIDSATKKELPYYDK